MRQPMGSDTTWWHWGLRDLGAPDPQRSVIGGFPRSLSEVTQWRAESGHGFKTGHWGAGTSGKEQGHLVGERRRWGTAGMGGTRRYRSSRPVPHPHRRPAAAPSAPAPSAQGRRVPPRARCGAAPRFWGRHHLHKERLQLAPAPGLRPPEPPRHREVGGRAGRQAPALNLPKFGRSSVPGPCAAQTLRPSVLGDEDPLQHPGARRHQPPHGTGTAQP